MPQVAAGEVELAYEDSGSGVPVVLVHGFTLDRSMWDPQVPALLDAGYRVVRYDLRGHGESSAPAAGYSSESHADDLASLIEAIGISPAHVVGLSLGGSITAALAEERPRHVRSITLLDANLPNVPFGDEFRGTLAAIGRRAQAGDLRGGLEDHWLPSPLFHPTNANAEKLAQLREMVGRFSGAPFFDSAPPRSSPSIAERMGEIKAPALVIVGELDLPDIHGFARTYAETIADARLQTIPAAGHMVNMDAPEAVNAVIIEFLGQVDRG
jgi:pimeloyl-ACP methyl ester carboxylesterase